MENEGAPPIAANEESDDTTRIVVYHGGHPLIRRRGVVLERLRPTRVSREIAEQLATTGDCSVSTQPRLTKEAAPLV